MRRMSVALTLDAVRARTKTVTRRRSDTWHTLRPGDRLALIEKGMGLPKGATQVIVAEVEVVDVRVEPLASIGWGDIKAEGLWDRASAPMHAARTDDAFPTPKQWFVAFWLAGHGYPADADPRLVPVRRIEWRYLDEAT